MDCLPVDYSGGAQRNVEGCYQGVRAIEGNNIYTHSRALADFCAFVVVFRIYFKFKKQRTLVFKISARILYLHCIFFVAIRDRLEREG